MIKYAAIIFLLFLFELTHGSQIPWHDYSCEQDPPRLLRESCHYNCIRYYGVNVSCENLNGPNIDLNQHFTDQQYDKTTTELRIVYSNIETLPHAAFFKVWNMSVLSMEDVNLRIIQPDAFVAHPHLMKIFFGGNKLVSIGDGMFNQLQDLTVLDLSRNRIENISENAFPHKLEILNLSRNSISTLGYSLQYLNDLKVLDISFNNITTIQNCINASSSISYDDEDLPIVIYNNLCRSMNWHEIYLRNNKIRSIEPLGMDIQVFNVGNNMLNNLSVELFTQSTSLKSLHLDGNGISTIPNSLFKALTHLRLLDLSNNNLSSFSYGTFDGLTEIETLNVSGNRLKLLPGAFHSLTSLNNLYLQNNDLHDLNLDLVNSMSNMQIINLNGNKWNCLTLRNITTQLRRRNISIISGFHSEGTNVFGMACHEDSNENLDKLDRITNGQKLEINLDNSNLQNFFNTDFKKSALYRFFVDDFKNTSFANRFQDRIDKKQAFEQNVETAFDRLESDFDNSSALFLETVQNITNTMDKNEESLRELIKTYLYKLENSKSKSTELENLTFAIKNLENYLEKFSQIIMTHAGVKSSVVSDAVDKNFSEAIAEKFVSEHFSANQDNTDHTFSVFFLILMIANVLLISAIVYIVAFRLKFDSTRRDIQMSPIMEDRS